MGVCLFCLKKNRKTGDIWKIFRQKMAENFMETTHCVLYAYLLCLYTKKRLQRRGARLRDGVRGPRRGAPGK